MLTLAEMELFYKLINEYCDAINQQAESATILPHNSTANESMLTISVRVASFSQGN